MNIADKTDDIRLAMLADNLREGPGTSVETQHRRIIEARVSLDSVTTNEAMRYRGCYDPLPRVYELHHKYSGVIATVTEIGHAEAGERQSVRQQQRETMNGSLVEIIQQPVPEIERLGVQHG